MNIHTITYIIKKRHTFKIKASPCTRRELASFTFLVCERPHVGRTGRVEGPYVARKMPRSGLGKHYKSDCSMLQCCRVQYVATGLERRYR